MSWIEGPDGRIIYGKRKTLGIKVWLSPEGEDADEEMFYSIWMSGKLNRSISFQMNGELVKLSEHPAKMKAEMFAYDPIAIAKCHGIVSCFQKCPRCDKIQKAMVHISTEDAIPDVLECSICNMSFRL